MSEDNACLIPHTLVPSGVRDERQLALAQLFGEKLSEVNLKALTMADPLTVDARLLPYMIREFGAQDFIDPELPIEVQRRILKNIWRLKSLHGFDAGVKLGLELLGMEAEIEHWHQMSPKGPANTQRLYLSLGPYLFDPSPTEGRKRDLQSAIRSIQTTQRWSQEIVVVLRHTATLGIKKAMVTQSAKIAHIGVRFASALARRTQRIATARHVSSNLRIAPARIAMNIPDATVIAASALHRASTTTIHPMRA